jgi:hypothetical protein
MNLKPPPSLDIIYSTSRAGAEAFSWLDPFVVISITDPESKPVSPEG